MPGSYVKIQSVTVGSGGSASMEFTNIPNTFDDLLLVASIRTDRNVLANQVNIRFNGDTGSNYSSRLIQGDGSSTNSTTGAVSAARIGVMPGLTSTASSFSNIQTYIPNYTGTQNKSVVSEAVQENNAASAYQELVAALWSSSAAIESIVFITVTSGNYVQYSSATLYGIKRN